MRKTWKMRAAALLLTAVCTVGASFAAYADDVPSGPAWDMELIQRREQASSSQNEAGDAQTAAGSENHAGAAEGQQTTENQETGNNGQTASETQGTEQGDSQVPDGMVASGGRYIDPNAPMVALTFDDGPYDRVTNRIVKVLAKNDSRATFFVVGNRVERYADAMKNAFNKGNQISTHTFDHGDLSKMKKKQIRRELARAFRVMKKINGEEPTMLRPPYGNVNDKMRRTIKIPMIYWSVDTEDWASRNSKKILKKCKSISDGDIVLMHDLYPSTAEAVEKLVPKLRKKGFQLVTVEELFYYKGIDAEGGKVYFSGK